MSKKEFDEAKELAETKTFVERSGIPVVRASPMPREEIEWMARRTRENMEKWREERIAEAEAIAKARNRIVF